ncbi:MAG: hypothetical protein AB1592_14365 [Pseudomonadota bacterium]
MPQTIKRSNLIRKLDKALSRSNDLDFLTLCWKSHAFQMKRYDSINIIRGPGDFINFYSPNKPNIYPWILETLINEYYYCQQKILKKKRLNTESIKTIFYLQDILLEIENEDDRSSISRVGVIMEIHRLLHRQVEWQRGFIELNKFYRSSYLYSGDLCNIYFEEKYGLDLNQFIRLSFNLGSLLLEKPCLSTQSKIFTGENSLYKKAMDIISLSSEKMHKYSRDIRSRQGHIAYQKSILRRNPCIILENNYLVCPIPELIFYRVTAGLAFDFADANGSIRNEIARKFEEYCINLFKAAITEKNVLPEHEYKIKKNLIKSPDIFLNLCNSTVVVECKAHHMTYNAKFSENPKSSPDPKYGEMIKAIIQIWKYYKLIDENTVDNLLIHKIDLGIIITLDSWLSHSREIQNWIFEKANQKADEIGIEAKNRIKILFITINDLEDILRYLDEENFLKFLQIACAEDYRGHHLPALLDNEDICKSQNKSVQKLPENIKSIFPWWNVSD